MFKTNDTKDRVNYGSLLCPPDGFTLQFAVGTTYSLDLEALTAVCLSLGLAEDTDSTLRQNPVAMLRALQKVTEKMLIFCEAGQIKMPKTPSSLSLLLEKTIVPVALPKVKGLGHYPAFHPKTWLLQYRSTQGEYRYRFAVLSRNLTFDRSWDITFSMDGTPAGDTVPKTEPLVHYLEFLRAQVKPAIQSARGKRSALRRLAQDLHYVSFTTDSKEFGNDVTILPLGIGPGGYDMTRDPLFFPISGSAEYSFHELVVFSPFLSGSLIDYWNQPDHSLTDTTRTLITRKSELAKMTTAQSSRFQVYTLKDDIVDGEDAVSDENVDKQKQDIHAKLYLRRKYGDVDLYLGSMNATYSAVNYNVEMMIRLRTKNRYYNGERLLRDLFGGNADNPQNPFELSHVTDTPPDAQQEQANRLEQLVKTICRLPMRASVIPQGNRYTISLSIDGPLPDGIIHITPFRRDNLLPLEQKMLFPQLDLLQLSEFYRLRVTEGNQMLERILMIPTTGIPEERENAVVNNIVRDKKTFVAYVAFVLGDSNILSLLEDHAAKGSAARQNPSEELPALYEKMLKIALEEPERMTEIGKLLRMITENSIVPDEFRELYAVFKKTLNLKE